MADLKLQLGLLKFEDVRTAIKDYFTNVRGIDYADGNNFSILIDALSYLQEMTSYQLSQQANNSFIRTSVDRKTAVENAYKLGYTPHRKIPNQITLTGYQNTTSDDVITYGSRTGYIYTIPKATDETINGQLVKVGGNLAIQEEGKTVYFAGTGLQNQKITLPTKNVSNSPIEVTIGTKWTKFDIFDSIPNPDSTIYFESESADGYTEITFGNGIIGQIPASDIQIEVKYFETYGDLANGETALDDITATFSSKNCGKDSESLESIKINGAKYHSSRSRLITKNDWVNFYKSLNVKSVDVSENAEGINYYYAGNIYVSRVSDNIRINSAGYNLNDELAKNQSSVLTELKLFDWKDQNTPISYLGELSPSSIDDSSAESKRIVGTNTTTSSPSYLFIDITPTIESTIKGYKFTNNDLRYYRNQLMTYAIDNLEGFDSDFRTDSMSRELFNLNDSVKSVKYDNNYSMIFDVENLIDTYIISMPDNFLATNDDYYTLDNNFLGNYYTKNNQPLDRHVIYSQLNSKTIEGLSFDRYMYNGSVSVEAVNFVESLTFEYDAGVVKNIQNFPVFYDGASYLLNIDNNKYLIATSTIGYTPTNTTIGQLIEEIDNGIYSIRIKLYQNVGGSSVNWNDLIIYDINKNISSTSSNKFRIKIQMKGTLISGSQSGTQYLMIDSKVKAGNVFISESGKLDFNSINIGNFVVETDKTNPTTKLNFKIDGYVVFEVNKINDVYTVTIIDTDYFENVELNNPIVDSTGILYFTEKLVHNTNIGEYNPATAKIYLDQLLTTSNNPGISAVTPLNQFLVTDHDILSTDVKYKMDLKPKYEIRNNNLIYKQDFDSKSGVYKLFNINTLRNL